MINKVNYPHIAEMYEVAKEAVRKCADESCEADREAKRAQRRLDDARDTMMALGNLSYNDDVASVIEAGLKANKTKSDVTC